MQMYSKHLPKRLIQPPSLPPSIPPLPQDFPNRRTVAESNQHLSSDRIQSQTDRATSVRFGLVQVRTKVQNRTLEASFTRSSSTDDFILSVTQDVTFAMPLVVVSKPSVYQLLETDVLNDLTLPDVDVIDVAPFGYEPRHH